MCHRSGELRQSVADNLTVVVAGLGGRNHLAFLVVDYEIAVIVDTGVFEHEEVAHALAGLNALQGVHRIGVAGPDVIVIVLPHILAVAEADKLVAARCADEVD